MKGSGVSGFIESMYIMCLFNPLAGVRPLHYIFLGSGVILVILGGKKRKGEMCPPLFPLSKLAPLLFPNSILSVPPGQQHSKTHTRISFSSVHIPSPPTSLQEEGKRIHHPRPNGPYTKLKRKKERNKESNKTSVQLMPSH